jgi:hypothetical protein
MTRQPIGHNAVIYLSGNEVINTGNNVENGVDPKEDFISHIIDVIGICLFKTILNCPKLQVNDSELSLA